MLRPLLTALLLTGAATAHAAGPADIAAARAILGEAVATPTVIGRGQVPALAAKLRARLVAAGFAPADVVITPVGETAILSAVYRGTGTARPIAVIGHMDVVEADPKDWTRDPFKMVEDGGYLFGRGVADNKFDVSMIVETLVRLKAEGFKPRRDIILYLSGDEETDGKTAAIQAKQAKAANVEFVLNGDSGGGSLGPDNSPVGYKLSGAEKTYADIELVFTNPGGHSSAPRADNAIYRLAKALDKVAAYQFPPMANELTRASLADAATRETGALGAALKAFAANPSDAAAAATISADPSWVGQVRTTCVATQLSGGHAPNALPQRAAANINCRIFPGTSVESVQATLAKVIGDDAASLKPIGSWQATDASPLRPDVVGAVEHAVHTRFPRLKVVAGMDSGASDSVFYRALGMPSYGVSGLFIKGSDDFMHGLNERVPVGAIGPALDHWHVLLTDIAK